MEDDARGVDSSQTCDLYVCRNCFGNPGLRSWVTENEYFDEDDAECSFCPPEKSSDVVAEFDSVCEYIVSCIENRYDDPAEELPYESAEGGYVGDVFDKWEVLEDAGLDLPNDSGKLLDAITSAMTQDSWTYKDYFGLSKDESLKFSWSEFVRVAKNGSVLQFMYGERPDDFDTMAPAELLDWLVEKIDEFGLVKKLNPGHQFFRIRFQPPGDDFQTAEELGPPPSYVATQANRLNPPNTEMMYAAEDSITARRETISGAGTYAMGVFELLDSVWVLDLTDLPDEICFFDQENKYIREAIAFLHHFAKEVSKPLEIEDEDRDTMYLPTQIVTQHFRRRIKIDGDAIHGIRYGSSKKADGKNVGMFGERIRVCDEKPAKSRNIVFPVPAYLQLVEVSEIEKE